MMHGSQARAEEIVRSALDAVGKGGDELIAALDVLPAPIYVTDADGVITHFNQACIGFAGRTPAVGKDRWCVTWKLYTNDGEFLPHDACPMAKAIQERSAVRGVTGVAERPDGVRVSFMPFPTPVFGEDGTFLGAVNMLIDITEVRQAAELRDQAMRCRRLARGIGDRASAETLATMAGEYETKAAELEGAIQSARSHLSLV